MTTKISADNIQPSSLATIGGGPGVAMVEVTNSSYTVLDDTAVSTSGGYIRVTGTKFANGIQVCIGATLATSVTIVSSTVLNVQVPATSAGTYDLYVVNTDGSFGIKPNGITFSPNNVTWVTGSTLATQVTNVAISIQLSATNAIGYQLQTGSSLPSGLTLTSGGLLSGTVTVASDTTYSFTIEAYDAELQDAPRTFSMTVSTAVAPTAIDYLVVAGGGGGGDRHGGGGGAGGFRTATGFTVSAGVSYTIVVGAGGVAGNYESGGLSPSGAGGQGGNSSFSTITSYGGGGGGTYDGNPSGTYGSGGGGGGNGRPGIAGTAGQGNSGGSGLDPGGGGGGGAGAVGGNAHNGSGGNGSQWLDGNYYAGGGGGAWSTSTGPATPGGLGGGGNGDWDDTNITAGTANTGGGGGATRSNNTATIGRPGGSGVVIIRYPDSYTAAASTTGSPTITVTGGYRYYKFTGSGTITF